MRVIFGELQSSVAVAYIYVCLKTNTFRFIGVELDLVILTDDLSPSSCRYFMGVFMQCCDLSAEIFQKWRVMGASRSIIVVLVFSMFVIVACYMGFFACCPAQKRKFVLCGFLYKLDHFLIS
jgi:hypothetical protein